MKTQIITDCLDLLAGFELQEPKEQKATLQSIIDTLGSYPKPQNKKDIVRAKSNQIASYLFVSNVRNACKLSSLSYIKLNVGFNTIQYNLESALSLLVDEIEVKETQTIK
jgi:hypothetical protein